MTQSRDVGCSGQGLGPEVFRKRPVMDHGLNQIERVRFTRSVLSNRCKVWATVR